jgi:hypothetical protein
MGYRHENNKQQLAFLCTKNHMPKEIQKEIMLTFGKKCFSYAAVHKWCTKFVQDHVNSSELRLILLCRDLSSSFSKQHCTCWWSSISLLHNQLQLQRECTRDTQGTHMCGFEAVVFYQEEGDDMLHKIYRWWVLCSLFSNWILMCIDIMEASGVTYIQETVDVGWHCTCLQKTEEYISQDMDWDVDSWCFPVTQ